MSRTKTGALPSYRLYKRTNQAVVTIDGHDHYLGPYGSPESKEKFNRLIGEWLAREKTSKNTASDPTPLTVNELVLAFWRHAKQYYRDSPKEREKIRLSMRPFRRLYGRTEATAFGPLALKAVRITLIKKLARTTINMSVEVIKRMFALLNPSAG